MFGFRIDADAAALAFRLPQQGQDLGEGRHLETAVVGAVVRTQLRQPLARAQRLDLVEREVLAEPARALDTVHHLHAAAVGEHRAIGDIGAVGQLVFVAGDQHAVARGHEVRLDEVRALLDRQRIRGQGVFGPVAAGAAVGDDQGFHRCWIRSQRLPYRSSNTATLP